MASELEVEIRDIRRWLRASLLLNLVLAATLVVLALWPEWGLWLLLILPLILVWTGYRSARARSRSGQYRGPDLCVACLTPMAEDQNTCAACGWSYDVA
ncbi:MAG: hypothetical protein H6807_15570 [Planctomycetes bacterium]|nr:hypothetical protein [Planctomycetota bacterium]